MAGSERLQDLTNRFQRRMREDNDQTGSLTHEHSHLDEEGIREVLARWPGKSEKPTLLLALHACGDLTVNAMMAYLRARRERPERDLRLTVVGCCYNLLQHTSALAASALSYALVSTAHSLPSVASASVDAFASQAQPRRSRYSSSSSIALDIERGGVGEGALRSTQAGDASANGSGAHRSGSYLR